eukprot:m.67883 g.67883  ORF g.67883 m.67883 type:complete len:58 (+) comp13864_c0_seq2:161-334(+)
MAAGVVPGAACPTYDDASQEQQCSCTILRCSATTTAAAQQQRQQPLYDVGDLTFEDE